jgi:hypothetical protein
MSDPMNSTRPRTPRKLRPREPIATAPTHVSQLTCVQIAGIDARRFLELLGDHPEVPRAAVGRLRIVAVDDLRALLARLATTATAGGDDVAEDDDGAPMTPDAVLARVGMRRSA